MAKPRTTAYERPRIVKQAKMSFTFNLLATHNEGKIACKQCSACHGCR